MSKRLNISVSDELALRMEPFKKEFNVSKVCANAIDKEVKMLERTQVAFDGVEYSEAISRLRRELSVKRKHGFEALSFEWYEWGQRFATSDASLMLLELLETGALRSAVDYTNPMEEFETYGIINDDQAHDLSDLVFKLNDGVHRVDMEMLADGVDADFDTGILVMSFQKGVDHVWKSIKPAVYGDAPSPSQSTEEE